MLKDGHQQVLQDVYAQVPFLFFLLIERLNWEDKFNLQLTSPIYKNLNQILIRQRFLMMVIS